MPERIQLSRRKGWRMPPNTIIVSRPSKWGNPYRAELVAGVWNVVSCDGRLRLVVPQPMQGQCYERAAKESAVRLFRAYLDNDGSQPGTIRDEGGAFLKQLAGEELRGKNLACWCKRGMPCHADVLLELANAEAAK